MIPLIGKYRTGQDALTPKEYEKILISCYTLEEEALIKVAVATGLRRADIVQLLWSNINLETGAVTYNEKKKGNRIRTVFVGPQLRQVLLKLRNTGLDDKRVFTFGDRTAYNILRALCDRARIPRRPFHALRATCVKRCQAAGWTPEEVCELTGDTLRVIQEHYATPSISQMAETAASKEVV